MAIVTGWLLSGCKYDGSIGVRYPGFTRLSLDDGRSLYFGEKTTLPQAFDAADVQGHNTRRIRFRTDEWVRTGVVPPG